MTRVGSEVPNSIAFLIWSATPAHPELCVTPLVHALAARALDCQVEVHFAGPAVRWLVEGVACTAFPTAAREKSILEFLHQAAAEGISLFACSMAWSAFTVEGENPIAVCTGMAGATTFVARTLDPLWRTTVF